MSFKHRAVLGLSGKGIIRSLVVLIMMGLSWQCQSPPTPPLPEVPAGPVIRLAILSPNAGEMATFGRRLRNGMMMALDEWNRQEGVLGRPIEWLVYDTGCEFDMAGEATRQAIADEARFIIGPLCSEAAIGAAEVVESAPVLMMAPVATHPLVTVNGQGQTRPYVFRASFAYSLQGQAAARFAAETLGVKRAAVLYEAGDDYTTALSEAFGRQFARQGGGIVYKAAYTLGDTDFSQLLRAVGETEAELIYLPGSAAVVNQVAGQLDQMVSGEGAFQAGAGPILLGSDSWETAELDLAGVEGSYFTTHFRPEAAGQDWVEAYKSTYAVEPDTLAAAGYEAAWILAAAIQKAGTTEVEAVSRTLETESFEGVSGDIRFDGQHNPIKPVPVVRVEEGRFMFLELVGP